MKRMRNEVSRASHTHQAPHIGLPQIEPVTRPRKVKTAPSGAAASRCDVGERMPPDQRPERGDRHQRVDPIASIAAGTCTYMIRTLSPCW